MDIKNLGWKRQPQEVEKGDYHFDGKLCVTRGVQEKLTTLETYMLIVDAMYFAYENKGIDYLIVYLNEERNLKLFFIDQVTKSELVEKIHPPEHHYATLMLAEEY